jgi:hypothetical protein
VGGVIGVVGAFCGVVVAFGVWLVVAGVRPTPPPAASRFGSVAWNTVLWRGGIVTAAGVVAWGLTGWPAMLVLGGGVAWCVPLLVGARRRREAVLARTDALATWAEMLRDTMAAQAGLREAIALSAAVAPTAIRADVQALAVRCERESVPAALRRFAVDVADPMADLIVAALVIAAERQARNLAELLGHIAASAREQAAMRIRVETGRARTYATAKWMVILTAGLAVVLLVLGGSFMAPYDSAGGQVALIVIGALFAGAVWGLVQLARPAVAPRLLAGVVDP